MNYDPETSSLFSILRSCVRSVLMIAVLLSAVGGLSYTLMHKSTALVTAVLTFFHAAPKTPFGSAYFASKHLGVPASLDVLFIVSIALSALLLCMAVKSLPRGVATAASLYSGAALVAAVLGAPCMLVVRKILRDCRGPDGLVHGLSSFIGQYCGDLFYLLVASLVLSAIYELFSGQL